MNPFKILSAESSGLDFENSITESDDFNIIEYLYFYNGAGVGAGDLNGDGLSDLVFNSNQSHPAIYINNPEDGIKLRDVSAELKLDTISGWGTGVALADVNGDGLLDIYLCQVGSYKKFEGRNRLLINKGEKDGLPQFKDETEEYGLGFSGLSTQAAFFDYDLDGDLDMYLLNHSTHQTSNYGKAEMRETLDSQNGDRLYRNNGKSFENVTSTSGIYSSKIGYGLGISISDLDNNGYPDIYIGNDFHENDYIYWNEGGQFREGIREVVTRTSQFSMGVDIADVNEDGSSDIFTLDMMPAENELRNTSVGYDPYNIFNFKRNFGFLDQFPHNNLQISDGGAQPKFSELAGFYGIESTDWSWSCLFEDYDLDGDKDLFISNGIMRRPNDLDYLRYIADPLVQEGATDLEMIEKMPSGKVANYLFSQKEDGGFENVLRKENSSLSNGSVYVDLDNDGDLEIVTNNINEPAYIYENISNESVEYNYLKVELNGEGGNRLGVGSKVEIYLRDRILYRQLNPQRGFMSSVDPVLNIGLGGHERIEKVIVRWPGGMKSLTQNVLANQTIVVNQSEGTNDSASRISTSESTYFSKLNFEYDILHQENEFNDLDKQKLAAQLYSREGPVLATTDLNNDGKNEFFIGAAKNQAPGIFSITDSGIAPIGNTDWTNENTFEDTGALFLDIDKDGDEDLIVISGGHDIQIESPSFANRIYLNDGSNNFARQPIKSVSAPLENSSCIVSADYDNDGDQDLFVGTRVDKYNHSHTPVSYILENDGKGNFDKRRENKLGMVTDAEWGDIDGDGDIDLVVVGDWMPITVLVNKEGTLVKKELPKSHGWWRTVKLEDINDDGSLDIIAGNFGLNNNLMVDDKTPMKMIVSKNGQSYMTHQNGVALSSADELIKQIPQIRKQFGSYKEYAQLDADELFGEEMEETKIVETLETSLYLNTGSVRFDKLDLPRETQLSSVNSVIVYDLNKDGLLDLIFGGNEFHLNTRFGKNDASRGVTLLQKKDNSFEYLDSRRSGLRLDGMIRSAKVISSGGKDYFLFAANDGPLQVYTLN